MSADEPVVLFFLGKACWQKRTDGQRIVVEETQKIRQEIDM